MSATVIEAKNLTKRYDGTAVVKGVSFSVMQGEIFGLLGPNGAGKTTTILMLLGLSDISDGQARVAGHDPVREPLQVKRLVGYLPDTVGFYDHMTAIDNLPSLLPVESSEDYAAQLLPTLLTLGQISAGVWGRAKADFDRHSTTLQRRDT